MREGKNEQNGLEIPYERLSEDALNGLIEAFVLREGTDYGDHEVSLSRKVDQVFAQLKSGEAVIVFDPETESLSIVPKKRKF